MYAIFLIELLCARGITLKTKPYSKSNMTILRSIPEVQKHFGSLISMQSVISSECKLRGLLIKASSSLVK
jgi:hypothetical protein